jgi:hypothetical protein
MGILTCWTEFPHLPIQMFYGRFQEFVLYIRPRRRWEGDIKMNISKGDGVKVYGLGSANSGLVPLASSCERGNGHCGSVNGGKSLG